uniref:Acid phosphatase n=1 Tax=Ditylenchus dipsaci TaxID=166011 RepID=A0A915DS26_9BILA
MDQLSQFENNLPWQPIPVHSSGADDPDPLLKPTSFDCPKYDEVAKETLDKLAKEMRAKYSRFFTFIEQNAENVPQDQQVAKGKPANKPSKMMLYSSHDGTIQALLHSMRLNDGKQVPYSACIFMEVHQVLMMAVGG